MTTLEGLRALRELLAVPERWCQRAFARCADGVPIQAHWWTDVQAVRWNIAGAIGKGPRNVSPFRVHEALDNVLDRDCDTWNDAPERTHADVLALIDAAIEHECLGAAHG